MQHKTATSLAVMALAGFVSFGATGLAFAQGAGKTTAETGKPALTQPAGGVLMHPEYAKAVARMAYFWGWPMVNMINRYDKITKAPHPGLLGGGVACGAAGPTGHVARLHHAI